MISVGQIKAARGLLEWNQSDLAEASGLHINAINNVERRHGMPRADTIALIQSAFEEKGIRFKGLTGVELVQESLEIKKYVGADIIRVLTDDVLSTMTNPDDELIAVMPDERPFLKDTKQNNRYYAGQKKIGFKHRLMLSHEEGESFMDDKDVRYLSEKILGTITYQVYGDKFVMINWKTPELVMIRSITLASSFRNQFEYLWQQAKPHKKSKKSTKSS